MIVPNPHRVCRFAGLRRRFETPGSPRPGAGLLFLLLICSAMASCRMGPREYLPVKVPVKVTEPTATPSGRAEWPAWDQVATAEGGANAEGTGAKDAAASLGDEGPLPPLSDSQWLTEAARVLDDWHLAAARGDRNRYLEHMAPDAVFMGTDGSERWDFAKFTAYVDEHFRPGGGWTYYALDRYVNFSTSKGMAWFDEKLNSPGYGPLRGTGVLRRDGSTWKIVHYSMTFLVPNGATAREVVRVIREGEAPPQR